MSRGAWQEVTHIEDRVGARGGEYWNLTLTCGHTIAHSKRKFRLIDVAFLGRGAKPRTAPHRKRCLFCKEDGDG